MDQPINKITREDVNAFDHAAENAGGMDLYQQLAVRSAIYPCKGTPFGLMYVALGLSEAGEAQNKVKKIFRDDGAIQILDEGVSEVRVRFTPISDARRAQVIKELGGLLWYTAALCQELGVTMSEVASANLNELCSRAERGTLSGDGDDR